MDTRHLQLFIFLYFYAFSILTVSNAQPRFWEPTTAILGGVIAEITVSPDGYVYTIFNQRLYRKTLSGNTWLDITKEEINLSPYYGNGDISFEKELRIVANSTGVIFLDNQEGLWRSTNNGTSWTEISLNEHRPGFAMDMNDHIYVRHLDGVNKSETDGNTWTLIPGSGSIGGSGGFLFVSTQGYLYANDYSVSANTDKMFRSTDGGSNWSEISEIDLTGWAIENIQFAESKDGSQYLFVRTEGEWGTLELNSLYRSLDNGNSWNLLPTISTSEGIYYDLMCLPSNQVVVGAQGGLYVSENQGNDWDRVNFADIATRVSSVAATSDNLFYIGQEDFGIHQPEDDSSKWNLHNKGLVSNLNMETIFKSMDGTLYTGMSVYNNSNYHSKYIYSTSNGGDLWEQTKVLGLDNGMNINDFAESPELDLFVSSWDGLFRLTDNGNEWEEEYVDPGGDVIFDIEFNTQGQLFARFNDEIRRSDDEGKTWETIFSTATVNAIEINKQGFIFLSTNQGLYFSIDNGDTWVNPSNNNINVQNMDKMTLDRQGRPVIYLSVEKTIYRSDDNGENWYPLGTALPSYVNALYDTPMGILYAATGDGVYEFNYDIFFNQDYWQPLNEGLPGGVTSLEVGNDNYMYASTSNGVFKSRVPISQHRTTSGALDESFDNEIPSSWTTEQANGAVNWAWTDTGPFASFFAPLESEHPNNGWVIFDADLQGGYNKPDGQEGWLISPGLFAGSAEKAFLSFNTFYQSFYDRPTIRIGTDLNDKDNWASIEVFPEISANEFGGTLVGNPELNPQRIDIDITDYLPGDAQPFYLAFVFLSDETTINGPNPNYWGWAYNWQIDDVKLYSYYPASDLGVGASVPPPDLGVPATQVAPFGMASEFFNNGYNIFPDVSAYASIEKTNGTGNQTVFEDSLSIEGLAPLGIVIIDPFQFYTYGFDGTFTPSPEPGTTYELKYSARPNVYQESESDNNARSYSFTVTDTLFQKEEGTTTGYSYSFGDPSYSIANIFYVPNDQSLSGMPLFARYMSFGVTNASELAGKEVSTALYKWEGDTNGNLILDQDELNQLPVAINSYTFTGNEGDNLITLPVSSGGFVPLEAGYHYVVMVRYEAEGAQEMMFQVSDEVYYPPLILFSASIGQPRYHAAVDYGNTGELQVLSDLNIPVIRLSIGPEVLNGIVGQLPKSAVRLYPSPAREQIHVALKLEHFAKDVTIRLLDASGKMLFERQYDQLQNEQWSFDIRSTPNGAYFLNVQADDKQRSIPFIIEN